MGGGVGKTTNKLGIQITFQGLTGVNITKNTMWTGLILETGEKFCGETLEELMTDFIFRITGEEHAL